MLPTFDKQCIKCKLKTREGFFKKKHSCSFKKILKHSLQVIKSLKRDDINILCLCLK